MVRSLDQIHRDQNRLEQATAKIDTQLSELYQQYLAVLGEATQQQLVLATYHLCTQSYPEAFLRLSMGQREKLQKRIRQLGRKGHTHIEALGNLDDVAATLNLLLQPLTQLSGLTAQPSSERNSEPSDEDQSEIIDSEARLALTPGDPEADPAAPPSALLVPAQVSNPFDSQALVPLATDLAPQADGEAHSDLASADESSSQDTQSAAVAAQPGDQPTVAKPLSTDAPSPLKLAKRHVLLERQIRAVLHGLSNMANHALQQAEILPDLPEAVLTAATEAGADEHSPHIPNLLNVIIEIGQEDPEEEADAPEADSLETDIEDSERAMTHLVAINLRLADIEFTNTRTALWRSKVQEILGQLKKLSRHYQKLQHECAQAEAEAAWRATWFEEQTSEPS
jgi:hypothetical protein